MRTLHITNSINRSPLRLAFLLIAVPLACLVMTPAARAETATAVGNCRSIQLDPATGYLPGLGQLRTYISTYDGEPGFPLYQWLEDDSILFSGELRSGNAQTGLYRADFATFDSVWSIQDYGSLTLTIPITDSDQNGLPDIAQKDKPGNTQVHGSVVSEFYNTFSSVTGTLSRPANSIAGLRFTMPSQNCRSRTARCSASRFITAGSNSKSRRFCIATSAPYAAGGTALACC